VQIPFPTRTWWPAIYSQVLETTVLAAAIGLLTGGPAQNRLHGKVNVEVHFNGQVWARMLCIRGGCPRNSSRSEPAKCEKKQPGHSQIPGSGGVGDRRQSHLYSDRSLFVPNQRTAATGRPLDGR
jgi:hypothetical protein